MTRRLIWMARKPETREIEIREDAQKMKRKYKKRLQRKYKDPNHLARSRDDPREKTCKDDILYIYSILYIYIYITNYIYIHQKKRIY